MILVLLTACDSNERKRPTTIPQSAVWKGGADGGCWILFKSISSEKLDLIIFYENGGVWEEGIYQKEGSCNVQADELANTIIGFNGQELVFKNNSCKYERIK